MRRLTKDEFLELFGGYEGRTVTVGLGTPNPETRDGVYFCIKKGLSNTKVFVGIDKTSGEFIMENVG